MPTAEPTFAASIARLIDRPERHAAVLERLAYEVEEVTRVFENQLAVDLPPVEQLCRYIERYRGKMLRPLMTLLSGLAARSVSGDDKIPELEHSHRVLAAVCEMIHMATLVHDDVLDDADIRRRGATVNYLHGNEAAVLLGDYLISNAFHLCSTLNQPELNERIGRVTNSMCAGELLQLHHRQDWSIDPETYLEIIDRKTASLIGVCCELGAAESGASADASEAMGEYGRLLGLAFQMQDDLLDVVGDEQVVGKSLGRDLEKRKLTLPIILYFRESSALEREDMLSLLREGATAEDMAQVRQRLVSSGCVRDTREQAEQYVSTARARLVDALPPSPARELLDDLAKAVVARAY